MKWFILFFCLYLGSLSSLCAQNEGANWCLLDSIGLKFYKDKSNPLVFNSYLYHLAGPYYEACASVSDTDGNLKYYIGPPDFFNYNTLYNHKSEIVNSSFRLSGTATNGALLLPWFENNSLDLFTIAYSFNSEKDKPRLFFHKFSTKAKNGKAEPVVLNRMLIDTDVVERIAAVRHSNGADWWVVSHESGSNNFLVWLVTQDTVLFTGKQAIGSPNRFVRDTWDLRNSVDDRAGEIGFNIEGNRLAYCAGSLLAEVLDFNRCTGKLSNPLTLSKSIINAYGGYYGLCFSPSGRFLYIGTHSNISHLFQYDLWDSDTLRRKRLIYRTDENILSHFGQMELAPNGKIYMTNLINFGTNMSPSHALSIIHHPDSLGEACGFELQGFSVGKNKLGRGLPNMPNYRLGPLPPVVADAGRADSLCRGRGVRIGSPGRAGWVYRWSPAAGLDDPTAAQPFASPDSTTTYRLTVTDPALPAPCNEAVDYLTVEVLKAKISASAYIFDLSKDTTIQFYNDSEGALAARWDFGTGETSDDYYPAPFKFTKRGTYRVRLTAFGKNDCFDTTSVVITVIGIPKNRTDVNTETLLELYPNPADEEVTVRFGKSESLNVRLFTLQGSEVLNQTLTPDNHTFSVRNLSAGVYFVRLTSGNISKTHKLIIQK